MRIITNYRGGIYDRELVVITNEFMKVEYSDIGRYIDLEEFRNKWFNTSWFKPEDFYLVIMDDNVLAYGYISLSNNMIETLIRIHPGLSLSNQLMVMDKIIEWIKKKVLKYSNCLISFKAGYEYRFLYNLLMKTIHPILKLHEWTLMKLDVKKYNELVCERFNDKIVFLPGSLENIKDLVEVYNDAFSEYPWFTSWDLGDAIRYYKSRIKNTILFLAYRDNEVIGFCDTLVYTNVSGLKTGYINILAVKKKYRGKGVGSALLCKTIEELYRLGYQNIYLDSIPGLEKYYSRRGFKIIVREVSLLTIL